MVKQFHILLADDDSDDRYFFEKAIKKIAIPVQLTTVEDGEQLMDFLDKNLHKLPDLIFLDLNMPRMNGAECLNEMRQNEKLKNIPVVIYSTSLHEEIADMLYESGAYYYLQKSDFSELHHSIQRVLGFLVDSQTKPERSSFILNS